ncbi:MAG TPA: hypothetical protein VGF69_11140 [Thermoanaerobaculia bacterium]|jgi:YD repeat-containing protein
MKAALLGIVLMLALSCTVLADQYPTLAKGFEPEKLYQFGDADSVNVFNGNVIVQIPIGAPVTLNGGLSYGLTLHYNSKAWDLEPAGPNTHAFAGRRVNAGMGWVLSMGRFFVPADVTSDTVHATYESPDGADHAFNCAMSSTETSCGIGCSTTYTCDGSRLRLRSTATWNEVDSPDGVTRRFEPDPLSGDDKWRLTQIRAAGTPDAVTVVYLTGSGIGTTPCPALTTDLAWEIKDSYDRKRYVCFDNRMHDGVSRPLVERVIVPAFGGTTATYRMTYTQKQVKKPLQDTDPSLSWAQVHDVQLLTEVQLPDGSGAGCTLNDCSKWAMDYCAVTPECDQNGAGLLTALYYPTTGGVRYAYGEFNIPALEICSRRPGSYNGFGFGFGSAFTKVASRTFFGGSGGDAVWTYDAELLGDHQSTERCHDETVGLDVTVQLWDEMTATVTDPLGHRVVNHFSVYPGQDFGKPDPDTSPRGFKRNHFGLPYGVYDPAQDRYLSQEVQAKVGTSYVTKKEIYVRHEQDGEAPHTPSRMVSSRTWFRDDSLTNGPCSVTAKTCRSVGAESDVESYDGYGHYRSVTTSGDLSGLEQSRTVFTRYNPLANRYGKTTAGDLLIQPDDPWILDMYDQAWTSDALSLLKSLFLFDPATGFMRARRVVGDPLHPESDLLVIYTPDGKGNVASERYYGGDLHPLTASAASASLSAIAASATPPGIADYGMDHTYNNMGVRTTSKYVGTTFLTYDVTVHAPTGLIEKSRDSALDETIFTYDKLGRVISHVTDGFAPTTYAYSHGAVQATVLVQQQHTTAFSTTELLQRRFDFDGLGRLITEAVLTRGSVWSERLKTYDKLGRVATVLEPGTQQPTTFAYDYAGRSTSITQPDGTVSTAAYVGSRLTARTHPFGPTIANVTLNATVTEEYDSFGRLVAITEGSGVGGTDVTTTYEYDLQDHLTAVRTPVAPYVTQYRAFKYDSRGLLVEEEHPESGKTFYVLFDAKGKARHRIGSHSILNLRYTYDAAERLIRVDAPWPVSSSTFRPLKEFTFGTANETGNRVLGKLKSAARYNYSPGDYAASAYDPNYAGETGTLRVTENYLYRSSPQEVTRETKIESKPAGSWIPVRTIATTSKYDDIGLLKETVYPSCNQCGFSSGSLVAGYNMGRVVTLDVVPQSGSTAPVKRVLNDATFWLNGMMKDVAHANGIVDSQDVGAMPRPVSITFGQSSPCDPPTVTQQPQSQTISPGGSVQLSIAATGTAPLQYEWRSVDNLSQLLGTGATYLASPTQTTTYVVYVKNDCTTSWSEYVTVTVGSCAPPEVMTQSSEETIAPGESTVLSVHAAGTGPHTFYWYRGAVGDTSVPVGSNSGTFAVSGLTQTTYYWVRVTNGCTTNNSVDSAPIKVAVRLPAMLVSQQLSATRTAVSSITVSWQAIAGAHHYELERQTGSAGFQRIPGNLTTTSYVDTAPAGVVYVYRVRGVDADGSAATASPYSNVDAATTLSFSTVQAGQFVSLSHFTELLTAVNAARATNGWPAVTWSQVLPSNVPAPSTGVVIAAAHMEALRRSLFDALSALGVPTTPYTSSPLDPGRYLVKAQHIVELQQRVQ